MMGCVHSSKKGNQNTKQQNQGVEQSYQNNFSKDEMAKIHEQRLKNSNKHALKIDKHYQQQKIIQQRIRENRKHEEHVNDWLN